MRLCRSSLRFLSHAVVRDKSQASYDAYARLRQYFYFSDSRGQMFLEDTFPKNMASCLKDAKFLNFLIKSMRRNDTDLHPDMDFVSYCGKEMNFVSVEDPCAALVFKSIEFLVDFEKVAMSTSGDYQQVALLTYGGNLTTPFLPDKLHYCPHSGRIYHPIAGVRGLRGELGLLHTNICQLLADSIHLDDENGKEKNSDSEDSLCSQNDDDQISSSTSSIVCTFNFDGKVYSMTTLPWSPHPS